MGTKRLKASVPQAQASVANSSEDVPYSHKSLFLLNKGFSYFLAAAILSLSLINGLAEPSLATLLWRVLLLLATLAWALGKESQAWNYGPLRYAALLWIWLGISSGWAVSPCLAWSELETRFLLLMLWVMVYDLSVENKGQYGIGLVLRFAFGFGLLYGLYQLLYLFPLMRDMSHDLTQGMDSTMAKRWLIRVRSTEVFGLRLYPNLFGCFALMSALFHLEGALRKGAWFYRWMLAFSLIMLVLSASKGAMLVGVASVALYIGLWLYKKGRLSLVAGFAIAMLALIAIWSLKALWFPLVAASIRVRWDYWASAWDMVIAHPMGVGVGMFSQWYSRYMTPDATEVQLLHNEHLQLLCEGGWVALILHVCFCGSILKPHLSFKAFEATATVDSPKWSRASSLLWCMACAALSLLFPSQILDVDAVPVLWWMAVMALWFWSFKAPLISCSPLLKLVMGVAFLQHACIDFSFHEPFLLILFFGLLGPERLSKDIQVAPSKNSPASISANTCFWRNTKKGLAWAMVLGVLLSLWYQQKLLLLSLQLESTEQLSDEDLNQALNFLRNDARSWELILKKFRPASNREALSPNQRAWVDQSLQNLSRLKPRSANIWKQRALLSSDAQERKKFFSLAEDLHPRQPQYAFLLAQQLCDMGEQEAAKVYYKKALDRHEYALSRIKVVWDMELHLLAAEQVDQARKRL